MLFQRSQVQGEAFTPMKMHRSLYGSSSEPAVVPGADGVPVGLFQNSARRQLELARHRKHGRSGCFVLKKCFSRENGTRCPWLGLSKAVPFAFCVSKNGARDCQSSAGIGTVSKGLSQEGGSPAPITQEPEARGVHMTRQVEDRALAVKAESMH